jgi:alcohol dehydrogenase
MIESGQIDTTPWITHRARCDQLIGRLPEWLNTSAGLIKAVVEF